MIKIKLKFIGNCWHALGQGFKLNRVYDCYLIHHVDFHINCNDGKNKNFFYKSWNELVSNFEVIECSNDYLDTFEINEYYSETKNLIIQSLRDKKLKVLLDG